jgi:hypothetical protein
MKKAWFLAAACAVVFASAAAGGCSSAPPTPDEATLSASEAVVAAECTSTCTPLNRACIFGRAGSAVCGACSAGFVTDEKGDCVKPTCAALNCEARHLACVANATVGARCGDACEAGYVWDEEATACRPTKKCADLACAGAQTCTEATPGEDAYCTGTACEAGKGFVGMSAGADGGAPTPVCRTCAFAPSCPRSVSTGNLLATSDAEGTSCICETRDNYFFSEAQGAILPCDLDGDGWVNEWAQPQEESANAVIRDNARCHVRRVTKIVVENELHAKNDASAASLTTKFPGGLPLYESAPNDGFTGDAPAPYGGVLNGKVLNALTKGCVDPIADYNGNGTPDVSEGSTTPIGEAFRYDHGTNAALASYYAAYEEYAYFLELHNGWYEAPTSGRGPGVYRIQERVRTASGPGGVALDALVGEEPFWNACPRHIDAAYADKEQAVRIGGDFSKVGGAWGAMTHHSQFKCVQIVAKTDYDSGGISALKDPQIFYVSGGKLARKPSPDKAGKTVNWNVGECTPAQSNASAPGRNPAFPAMTCTAGMPSSDLGVAWAVVTGHEYDADGDYVRGCVDMCKEPAHGGCATVAECSSDDGLPVCTCPASKNFQGDGLTCTCKPLYNLSADKKSCVSLCSTNNGGCAPDAICSLTSTAVKCACPAHEIGNPEVRNGHCYPDKCADHHGGCDEHASCTNSVTGAAPTCRCTSPYEGNGKDCVRDLCGDSCPAHESCVRDGDTKSCECVSGYSRRGSTCVSNTPTPTPTADPFPDPDPCKDWNRHHTGPCPIKDR